jgi:hypothetical protein
MSALALDIKKIINFADFDEDLDEDLLEKN